MKSLQEYITEAMALKENMNVNDIDKIINDWLKKNGITFEWNTKDVAKYVKAIQSQYKLTDEIERWEYDLEGTTDTDKLFAVIFEVLKLHPDWGLKEYVAWRNSGVKVAEPDKYNEYQFNYNLNKILKKFPN